MNRLLGRCANSRSNSSCRRVAYSNGYHTVFYRHQSSRITILAVYVDDIVITGDDVEEIMKLKGRLGRAFEVKDLGLLRYFLGIEIARSSKGIILSQRKYVLDLLAETGMLGCRPCGSPLIGITKLVLSQEIMWIGRDIRG